MWLRPFEPQLPTERRIMIPHGASDLKMGADRRRRPAFQHQNEPHLFALNEAGEEVGQSTRLRTSAEESRLAQLPDQTANTQKQVSSLWAARRGSGMGWPGPPFPLAGWQNLAIRRVARRWRVRTGAASDLFQLVVIQGPDLHLLGLYFLICFFIHSAPYLSGRN